MLCPGETPWIAPGRGYAGRVKSDRLFVAIDGNFDLVVPKHPVLRCVSYVFAVIGVLTGPALIVVIAMAGELHPFTVIGGIAIFVTIGIPGIASGRSTARMQRRVNRVKKHGRPATAHAVGSMPVSLGEESGTQLTLSISGPKVPEYRTRLRGTTAVRDVGDTFEVLVDPRDNAWMLRNERSVRSNRRPERV